jgi:SAM-dependent methyltransferase
MLYTSRFVTNDDMAHKDLLEVGCGYGWFALNALDRGARSYTGIEPTPGALETAALHITAPNARLLVSDALQMPFDAGSFDTVACWEVLEHLPQGGELRMFMEVRRVLRDGGVFYLSTPYRSIRSMLFDPAFLPLNHRHYTESDLNRLATWSGMNATDVEVVGRWWETASTCNMYAAKWLLRRGIVFKETFDRQVDREYSSGRGWARLFGRFEAAA